MSSPHSQYSSLTNEESGKASSASISPLMWKIMMGAVFMNACVSLALISIVIVVLVNFGTVGGMVPGTVFPSLVSAAQTNFDPKNWKDTVDAGANFMKQIDDVDWSFKETVSYDVLGSKTTVTCSDLKTEDACMVNEGALLRQDTYDHQCEVADRSDSVTMDESKFPEKTCAERGGMCNVDYLGQCIISCTWDPSTSKCTGNATSARTELVENSKRNSEMTQKRFQLLTNAWTKASKDLGNPVGHHTTSPLDVTKFIRNIFNADWHNIATQCQTVAEKCVSLDFTSLASGSKHDAVNAKIHASCKAFGTICKKAERAFAKK